ncbi:alpha/beta hydrolase family protein [Thalassomonas sp. M1454]|uniref:alpha/beta hydrolase family protein n=1 Tax=Thalassomonas sp. M1454 TaxID=2594477 RepID=UPI00117C8E45|nr:S9 family peptidase [Thalassomonas sp. M1454]TRX54967.1 S9 family peptidase [Thalassomonas sp. M1454]
MLAIKNRNKLIAFSLSLFCIANVNGVQAQESKSVLQYADVFELEYASSPVISADKKSVIYERRSMDIMSDSTRTNLWQVNLDGSNNRPLLSGKSNFSSPTLSADGKQLAYVSSFEGDSQLYVRWLDTGQTARVTNLQSSPRAISWSPDGSLIAFSMFVPSKSNALFKEMPKQPKGAKWAGTATYIDSVTYRRDGGGYVPAGFSHIFLVPSEGGTPRQITSGDFHHGGPINWTADGKQIIIDADRHANWAMRPVESDVYAINIADGKVTELTKRLGPDSSPLLSPDGKNIAYLVTEDRKLGSQNSHLYVMDINGKKSKDLTPKLDRSVNDIQWASDGSGLYFSYADHGQEQLGFVTLNGKFTAMKTKLGGQSLGRPYTSGEFNAVGDGRVVFTQGNAQRPADLAVVNTKGEITQLTNLNEDLFGHKELAKVRSISVTSSFDEKRIEAWIALPPGFDPEKKYPLILEIHGGPHAAYGPNFAMEVQLMAAKGYVVVWANPRGSTSYGEEFANLIHHNYPSQDYDDLMDVVDGVIEEGYIDEQQLFVTGGSGGGTLTAWIVGKTKRFKAAVVAKPVINWLSFSLTADGYTYFTEYWMPGKPWDHVMHLWKRSPLSLVGNVETPTMLLTGENDYRTPMSETEQYYQALKLQNVDTAMVKIKKSGHSIAARPSNLVQKVGNILAWFEKYRVAEK